MIQSNVIGSITVLLEDQWITVTTAVVAISDCSADRQMRFPQ